MCYDRGIVDMSLRTGTSRDFHPRTAIPQAGSVALITSENIRISEMAAVHCALELRELGRALYSLYMMYPIVSMLDVCGRLLLVVFVTI